VSMSEHPGFRSALACRRFRLLCVAHGLGTVGQLVLTLAVGVHVLEQTGSGSWASVTIALAFAPYAVFSPLAGVLADRRSRSSVLTWSFGLRAALAAGVLAGMTLGWPVPVVVAVTALLAVAATPAYPALTAATPECVPDGQLPPANALVTCVENASWMAGPGVFGLLLLTGLGTEGAVLVAATTFGAAAGAAARVRLPRPRAVVEHGWWTDLRVGVGLVSRRQDVRRPMALAVLDNFLYGYLVVALVLLVAEAGLDQERLGWLNTALAAGAVASMAVVNRLTRGARVEPTLAVMLVGFCACVVTLGVVGPGVLGVILVVLAGGATLVAEVAAVTMLQRATDPATLARVFGVYDQLNVGAIALGSLIAGPLAAQASAGRAVVAVGGVCSALALLLVVRRPGKPRLREAAPVPALPARR
jgi:MFS family permease